MQPALNLDVGGTTTSVKVPKINGTNLLLDAALVGDIEGAKKALDIYNANISGFKGDGSTALMLAADRGYEVFVSYLLNKSGININQQDALGVTALYAASLNCNVSLVNSLLEKRADPNIGITSRIYQDGLYFGWTPLRAATVSNGFTGSKPNCQQVINLLEAKGGRLSAAQ